MNYGDYAAVGEKSHTPMHRHYNVWPSMNFKYTCEENRKSINLPLQRQILTE